MAERWPEQCNLINLIILSKKSDGSRTSSLILKSQCLPDPSLAATELSVNNRRRMIVNSTYPVIRTDFILIVLVRDCHDGVSCIA